MLEVKQRNIFAHKFCSEIITEESAVPVVEPWCAVPYCHLFRSVKNESRRLDTVWNLVLLQSAAEFGDLVHWHTGYSTIRYCNLD